MVKNSAVHSPSDVGRLRPTTCGLRPAIIYIGIGSNIGDRLKNIKKAITLMAEHVKLVEKSCIYETEPAGGIEQGWFLNCVVKLTSAMPPFKLFRLLKSIEKMIGRKKKLKWGPRIIDLDILLYNDEIINKKILKIPHPEMHRREFVLIPLKDIYPDFIHPVFKKTIPEMLSTSEVDRLGVRVYDENN
jgi:2-amino-4-hydroxy-6-hydroxymethyldihydropteridine diphosphokinase